MTKTRYFVVVDVVAIASDHCPSLRPRLNYTVLLHLLLLSDNTNKVQRSINYKETVFNDSPSTMFQF